MSNPEPELTMDRAHRRTTALYNVLAFILEHWKDFPPDLYQRTDGGDVEFDMREFLFELALQKYANIITPAVLWRMIATKINGLTLPEGVEIEEE